MEAGGAGVAGRKKAGQGSKARQALQDWGVRASRTLDQQLWRNRSTLGPRLELICRGRRCSWTVDGFGFGIDGGRDGDGQKRREMEREREGCALADQIQQHVQYSTYST